MNKNRILINSEVSNITAIRGTETLMNLYSKNMTIDRVCTFGYS